MNNIDDFLTNLRLRGYSPRTIAAYKRELLRFHSFLKGNRIRITGVKPRDIQHYLDGSAPLQPASISRRLAALSSFFEFFRLMSDGRARNPVDPIRRPKRQMPRPKAVNEVHLDALLKGISGKRDLAVVQLLVSSGLRLQELCSLNRDSIRIEQFRLSGGTVRNLGVGSVVGKGNRQRDFFVHINALACLHDYLKTRKDEIEPMFISSRKQRLSPRAIEHMLHRWCLRLGIPRIHPHALRHTFSTKLHRLGVPTLELSRLLGHSSIETTQRYIKPDQNRIRSEYFAAMEKCGLDSSDSS